MKAAAGPIVHHEAGLTLVELLISITILGLILPVLFSTMFAGAHDITGVASKILDSHDSQMLSAYFVQDVQSADDVEATNNSCTPPSSGDPDGDGDSDGGAASLLALHWTDRATNDQRVVTYYMDPESAPLANSELLRQYCVNGNAINSVVIAHGLAGTAVFTCTPSCAAQANLTQSVSVGNNTLHVTALPQPISQNDSLTVGADSFKASAAAAAGATSVSITPAAHAEAKGAQLTDSAWSLTAPSQPTGISLQVAEASGATTNCTSASSLCFTASASRRSSP